MLHPFRNLRAVFPNHCVVAHVLLILVKCKIKVAALEDIKALYMYTFLRHIYFLKFAYHINQDKNTLTFKNGCKQLVDGCIAHTFTHSFTPDFHQFNYCHVSRKEEGTGELKER